MEWFYFFSFPYRYRYSQGSVLFLILSALYLSLIFQEKSFEKSNTFLFCSYNIILFLLKHFCFVLEYGKSEVFHFFRSYSYFNPFFLNLSHLRGSVLYPKDNWRYLGFIFNRKLSFWQYIKFYSNKVLLTVKCMKILGNSMRGLLSY